MIEFIQAKSYKRILGWRFSIGQLPEIEDLNEYSDYCCCSSDHNLIHIVLRPEEGYQEVNAEDIRVYSEEFELNLIMDHLHSVVVVYIHLIFDIQINKNDEDKKQYNRNLESKEGYQWPHLKQYN